MNKQRLPTDFSFLMSHPSDEDDLIARYQLLKDLSGPEKSVPSSDSHLAERFAKLTGNAPSAFQSSSQGSYSRNLNYKSLTEGEMVDDLLSQIQEEAKIEKKVQKSSEQSLEDRLARLKASSTSTNNIQDQSTDSQASSPFTSSHVAHAPKENKTVVPSSIDIGWISSDDENNEDVLDRVIQAALNCEISDEE